jgi:hypothetical protein
MLHRGPSEKGNEISGSLKLGKYLEKLGDSWFPKLKSALMCLWRALLVASHRIEQSYNQHCHLLLPHAVTSVVESIETTAKLSASQTIRLTLSIPYLA